jgi:hypothetical protein
VVSLREYSAIVSAIQQKFFKCTVSQDLPGHLRLLLPTALANSSLPQ